MNIIYQNKNYNSLEELLIEEWNKDLENFKIKLKNNLHIIPETRLIFMGSIDRLKNRRYMEILVEKQKNKLENLNKNSIKSLLKSLEIYQNMIILPENSKNHFEDNIALHTFLKEIPFLIEEAIDILYEKQNED